MIPLSLHYFRRTHQNPNPLFGYQINQIKSQFQVSQTKKNCKPRKSVVPKRNMNTGNEARERAGACEKNHRKQWVRESTAV